jgi:hypothetical protein
VKEEASAVFVEIGIDMIDTLGVKAGGAAFEAVDFVALL